MPAKRKPIHHKYEGKQFAVRYRHPLAGRVVRLVLGTERKEADGFLNELNAIFLHETNWHTPPEKTSSFVLDAWRAPLGGVQVTEKGIVVNGLVVEGAGEHAGVVAGLHAVVQAQDSEIASLRAENRRITVILKREYGKKYVDAPTKTLRQALDFWTETFKGGDEQHRLNVVCDLNRFIAHFKPDTGVDSIEGKERDILSWLNGIKVTLGPRTGTAISAGRRAQIRRHCLKFLEDSGAVMARKAIPAPKDSEIRRDRGAIRWLERSQAEAMHKNLEPFFADMFLTQITLGLRPEELLTLKATDFSPEYKILTLSPNGEFTLKTGSRSFSLATLPELRKMFERRAKANELIFPNPTTDEPWKNAHWFNRNYRRKLRAAAVAAGVTMKIDNRIGRRTCGSLLLRGGKSVEEVAALLGNSPDVCRAHYAAILAREVDASSAALK